MAAKYLFTTMLGLRDFVGTDDASPEHL